MFHLIAFPPILFRYHAAVLLASLMLLAIPFRAYAEAVQVFEGSAGPARVVMELEATGNEVTGRYFYGKYRLDLGLAGSWSGETLTLAASTSGDSMILRRNRKGLAGSLVTKNGRKVPVNLTPIPIKSASQKAPSAIMPDLSPYEQVQLADLALVRGETRQDGSRVLRNWREPFSGIEMFRIESGYPAAVLDKINAAFERQQWERVSQWFACEGYGGEPGMDISEVRSPYLGDEFVSYAWFVSYSCAGTAHPDFGTQGYTFNAQTGRELVLEDLLYFGAQPVPAAESTEFYTYRTEVFSPRVVALLGQLYPHEMIPAETADAGDECDYADSAVWNFPSGYLTKDGLYLGAYFGRAMRPCDEPAWAVIPWRYLTYPKVAGSSAPSVPSRADALHFGQLAFGRDEIALLAQGFDHAGFPVLDIVLQPEATKRLEVETIRLLNTDVTFALGSTTLVSARLVEPLTEGKLRLSGRFSLAETRAMAGQIICAVHLSTSQYDPPSLANTLPCNPKNGDGKR